MRQRTLIGGEALPFATLNSNLQAVTLNLKTRGGRQILMEGPGAPVRDLADPGGRYDGFDARRSQGRRLNSMISWAVLTMASSTMSPW